MTSDDVKRDADSGQGKPRPEAPQPTPYGPARPGKEPAVPPPEEGVERPPFPTRGDIDTEC